MIALFATLIPLAVMALIVFLVVRAVRGRSGAGGHDLTAIRRFAQYGFLFASLGAAGYGLARLLTFLVAGDTFAGVRTDELALGVALVVVAGPIWALLLRASLSALRTDPAERAAPSYAIYLVAALTGSLIVAVVNLVRLGQVLVGVDDYVATAPAFALVGLLAWGGHLVLLRNPRLAPTAPLVSAAVLAGSLVGLVTVSIGIGSVVAYGLHQLYSTAFGPPLALGPQTGTLLRGAVLVAVGGPVWWWHWLRQALVAERDVLWHVYVLLLAVFGGLVTALVATGQAVYTVLEWFFADPAAFRAPAHFVDLPVLLATFLVGVALWWYHRMMLAGRLAPVATGRTELERVYGYLVAAIGLLVAVAGAVTAVAAAIQVAVPDAIALTDPLARRALVLAATLVLIGTPVWGLTWRRMQASVLVDAPAEVRSPSRRVYIVGLLTVSAVVTAISLAVLLYQVLRQVLDGTAGVQMFVDLRIALALVLVAGAVGGYLLALWRDDRALAPVVPPEVHPRRVLLVSPDGPSLAAAVASESGARVRSLHRTDMPHRDVDAHQVAELLREVHHRDVLVTIDPDGSIHVIPYEDA